MKNYLKLLFIIFLFSQCEVSNYVKYGATSAKFKIRNDTAYVHGILGKKAYHRLENLIDKNPQLKTLTLLDVPGSIDDDYNIKSCYLINDKKLNTHLTSKSIIASGGVDFFLAGQQRSIEQGAKVGVHSWSDGFEDGANIAREDSSHHLFLGFYKSINIDTSFYWFTLQSASADSIHWLTYDEMIRYGVIKN
ncbi:MAG: hypothetical protein ISP71_06790 [Flavobacteriales bacterium]|nr:hypothetical protein [Flavobacteriales bacterium]